MVEFGQASQILLQWLLSPLIWVAIIFIIVFGAFGFLKIRKKRKLLYPCLELVDYSYGKSGFNLMRCGYFGKKTILNGLFDYGEEELRTQDGDIIFDFSTNDFQEINGKRGVVVARHPQNQRLLFPISKINLDKESHEMIAEVAPAEFAEAALNVIDDSYRETTDWKEKAVQYLIIGGIVIFALVSIIVIAQLVKQAQTEASNLVLQAGDTCLKSAKEVCQTIASSVAGQSP